jgi:Ni,Fe-hydrogenase I cytochrome b subunit
VYSAILIDIEERNGVMTSIFSGYKWRERREAS